MKLHYAVFLSISQRKTDNNYDKVKKIKKEKFFKIFRM